MGSINIPGLDEKVTSQFPLERLKTVLLGGFDEARIAFMLGDATMYPTAVYVGDTNEILNLLPDMDGSIRTDDPTKQPRSGEFFNGRMIREDQIEQIKGVAAYKIAPVSSALSQQVSHDAASRVAA